jgi:chaperonin GroES
MRFRPLHDRVVVRRLEEEQKTKGGIIIPIPQRRSRKPAR